MKYITGIHALNLPCELETCGDWHSSALAWRDMLFLDSESVPFGDYGIELGKPVPLHDGEFAVANHIRALLDLIYLGNFSVAQGMRDDFVCNDRYTGEIFDKVRLLRGADEWPAIDDFMCREYKLEWLNSKEKRDAA